MDQRWMESVLAQINERFDRVDDSQADTLAQVRKINGGLTDAHVKIASLEARQQLTSARIETVSTRTHAINDAIQSQERRLLIRDSVIVMTTAAAVAAAMKWGKAILGIG